MTTPKDARRTAARMLVAAALAVAALVAAHVALIVAVDGTLDYRLALADAGLAALLLGVVAWHLAALADERERRAVEDLLVEVLAEPRKIEAAAAAALDALVGNGVADAGVIALADGEDGEMKPLAAIGYPAGWIASAPAARLMSYGASPSIQRNREPHPWLGAVEKPVGKRAWVARVPLHSGADAIGLLLLATRRPGPLRAPGVLARVAHLVSAALDHAALNEAAYQRERDLEELDARRREFMAAISHEVRTPLTSIQAFADLLRLDPGSMDETAEQLVASLTHGVDRLNALVSDLIDLGRQGGADYQVELEEVDVGDAVRAAEEVLRPAFMLRGQRVDLEEVGPEVYAIADRRLLDQVILNLLSNANRHSPPGGEVRLCARREGETAVIRVHDSGPGIRPEDRARIFEPYYRVRREGMDAVPGSGLGLAVARRIVDALDGRIFVEPSEGAGATFIVELRASTER